MRWDEILKRLPENAIMAEIGVWKGSNAYNILTENETVKIILIDRWKPYTPSEIEQEGFTQVPQSSLAKFNLVKRQTYTRMEKFTDRVTIVETYSEMAAKYFSPQHFDLVFIDALHSFEGCLADIKAWYRKVKIDGYIGGHDITRDGVRTAVEKMFGNNYDLGTDKTWWVKRI